MIREITLSFLLAQAFLVKPCYALLDEFSLEKGASVTRQYARGSSSSISFRVIEPESTGSGLMYHVTCTSQNYRVMFVAPNNSCQLGTVCYGAYSMDLQPTLLFKIKINVIPATPSVPALGGKFSKLVM